MMGEAPLKPTPGVRLPAAHGWRPSGARPLARKLTTKLLHTTHAQLNGVPAHGARVPTPMPQEATTHALSSSCNLSTPLLPPLPTCPRLTPVLSSLPSPSACTRLRCPPQLTPNLCPIFYARFWPLLGWRLCSLLSALSGASLYCNCRRWYCWGFKRPTKLRCGKENAVRWRRAGVWARRAATAQAARSNQCIQRH